MGNAPGHQMFFTWCREHTITTIHSLTLSESAPKARKEGWKRSFLAMSLVERGELW